LRGWYCQRSSTKSIPTTTMGRDLMASRTDRTMRIPSGVASPLTTNHAAKRSVFVNLRSAGNLKNNQLTTFWGEGLGIEGLPPALEHKDHPNHSQHHLPLLPGFGFRVWDSSFRVSGVGFLVPGVGFQVSCKETRSCRPLPAPPPPALVRSVQSVGCRVVSRSLSRARALSLSLTHTMALDLSLSIPTTPSTTS